MRITRNLFLLLLASGPFAILVSTKAYGQCGLPGTPACGVPKKTVVNRAPRSASPRSAKPRTTTTSQPSRAVAVRRDPTLCESPDIPGKWVTCTEYVRTKFLEPSEDRGYNLAYVKYDRVLLREHEWKQSGHILKRGDLLVVLDEPGPPDWLKVVDIESGSEGWVYKGHVEIYLSRTGRPEAPVFAESRANNNDPPEVRVKNDSNTTLFLRLSSATYSIGPHSEQYIYPPEGNCKYLGSAPGVLPAMGEKYFSKGHIYSWTFYVN